MSKHLRTAKVLAILLDSRYSLFGIKFGIDPIFDLVPGLGNIAGVIMSSYLVWIALKIELPSNQIWKMLKNITIDFIVGVLPVIGPVADIFYRANQKNFVILDRFAKNIIEGEII